MLNKYTFLRKIVIITIGCVTSFSAFCQYQGDQLFKQDQLHEIRIESTSDNFCDDLFNIIDFENYQDHTYLPAKVYIDGNYLDSVGIRMKGGITLFDNKKPLKLDFNEFIEDQKYDGLKKINLHGNSIDATMQREAISYDILRTSGLKSPRTAYTTLYIDDVFRGVYLIVEQIDKTFLKNYFADDNGVLYKSRNVVEVWSDEGTMDQYNELKTILENYSGEELKVQLDNILDSDAFIRHLAMQIIMSTVDNLISSYETNLVIYHEPKSDLLYYIPWDFNSSLFSNSPYSINHISNFKMMQVPSYWERYIEILCDNLSYNFTKERIFPILDGQMEMIKNDIQIDEFYDFTFEAFNIENQNFKTYIDDRNIMLKQELSDLGYTCPELFSEIEYQQIVINEIVTSSDATGGISDPAGSYPDWIELYNNSDTDFSLNKIYLSDDVDFKKHWKFPDGSIIEAHEYLVVWADRDLDESGLHCDFKLDKTGGELYLTFEDFSIVDSMSYGQIENNIGYARVPNGAGDFIEQETTFLASNQVTSTMEENIADLIISPNPSQNHIQITGEFEGHIDLKFLNLKGEEVKSIRNVILPLETSIENLSSGTYYIELYKNKKEITTLQFIKL